jgi:hypothetical protein
LPPDPDDDEDFSPLGEADGADDDFESALEADDFESSVVEDFESWLEDEEPASAEDEAVEFVPPRLSVR